MKREIEEAVNIPPLVFTNPDLTWGGNEEGTEMVSGSGNFGNLLCFENAEKSVRTIASFRRVTC